MNVLDTDILSLFVAGRPTVVERVEAATADVVTTVVSRIEIMRGRFDFLLKAANAQELVRAQDLLSQSEEDLEDIPVLLINAEGAAEFERLRKIKKLKRIGRSDLLIASIVLANNGVLVTRNVRDFQLVPQLHVEDWSR